MVRASFLVGLSALATGLAKEIDMTNIASSVEYTSGVVHAELMGYKMVSAHKTHFLTSSVLTIKYSPNGRQNLLQVPWKASSIQSLDIQLV